MDGREFLEPESICTIINWNFLIWYFFVLLRAILRVCPPQGFLLVLVVLFFLNVIYLFGLSVMFLQFS